MYKIICEKCVWALFLCLEQNICFQNCVLRQCPDFMPWAKFVRVFPPKKQLITRVKIVTVSYAQGQKQKAKKPSTAKTKRQIAPTAKK